MKYMTMVSSAESYGPPPAGLIEAIMKLGEEAAKAGVLVEQGGLHRSARGLRMRISKGALTVTDGPFAESKEVIGGYAVYSVNTREEIVEWTRRLPAADRPAFINDVPDRYQAIVADRSGEENTFRFYQMDVRLAAAEVK